MNIIIIGSNNTVESIIRSYEHYMYSHNLTQTEAAALIQTSRTHLNKIFNGKDLPSTTLLLKMEEILRREISPKIEK